MLFKILHGDESRISTDITPFHEGWAYATHSGNFYVDMNIGTIESPNNQRIKLNSANAETIAGMSLEELKNEIATQDAVILYEAQAYTDRALEVAIADAATQDAVILHEAQAYTDTALSTKVDSYDEALETTDKTIIGAINEINEKRLDKMSQVGIYSTEVEINGAEDGGILCFGGFAAEIRDEEAEDIYNVFEIGSSYRVPLVAGENVTFTHDTDNQVVVVNASVDLDNYQTKTDESLETTSNEIVGAINEINEKRLDKAEHISIASNSVLYDEDEGGGIQCEGWFYANKDGGDTDVMDIPLFMNIPIVAGENVNFEEDTDTYGNNVVKISASGSSVNYSEGLTYEPSDDNTYYICTGIGTCTDVDIVFPAEYTGLPVKEIRAFSGNKTLKSIVIPGSVETIGHEAFMNCTSLTNITMFEGLTTIGICAFYNTGLKNIVLPNTVTQIHEEAFAACAYLESIVIPSSVTYIEGYTFSDCSNLTICCEVAEVDKPDSWDSSWNVNNCSVIWEFANDFITVNKKINTSGIPSFDATEDDGKFYRIVDGQAGWFPVPNAEDNAF